MKYRNLYAFLLCGLLVGCTGDPTRGGIFWSESKAKERQAVMMQSLQGRTELVNSAEGRVSDLRDRLSAVQAQLARARQKAAAARRDSRADPECVRLQRKVDELKRQVEILSREQ